jgi:hypothetical protein
MSIPVELTELHETLQTLERPPYLLTVDGDGRAHCVAVTYEWRGDELALAAGNRTLANATARPNVSLVWPPNEVGGHSLIVDGDVTHAEGTSTGDNVVVVRPSRAVLHRPADGPPAADGCGADCVPLLDRAQTG